MSIIIDKKYFVSTMQRKLRELEAVNKEQVHNILYRRKIAYDVEEMKAGIRREIGHLMLLAEEFLTHEEFVSMLCMINLNMHDAASYKLIFIFHVCNSVHQDVNDEA